MALRRLRSGANDPLSVSPGTSASDVSDLHAMPGSRVSGTASPNSWPAITNSGRVHRYIAEPLLAKPRAARDGAGAFDP